MENKSIQDLLDHLLGLTPSELADALNDPAIIDQLVQMGMGPPPPPAENGALQYDPVPESKPCCTSADEAARRNRKRLGL